MECIVDAAVADAQPAPYVKLISAEGHEFFVDRKCAQTSGTIKAMLSGSFTESSGEIKFPEISTPILEKVIQYFYYKASYKNSQVRIPEFDRARGRARAPDGGELPGLLGAMWGM